MTEPSGNPGSGESMNVAKLVGRTLAQLGAGHVFGVVGSGNFEMTNALREFGVPFTAARHEGGAATMADAYARMSGRVGIVSVHQGCGLTNAITGIGEAAKSRTPVLVLAAETARSAVNSNFAMNQDALAQSVGAISLRVNSAASAVADTVRAYRTAVNSRHTVVLNLPLDVQAQAAPAGTQDKVEPVPARAPIRPHGESAQAMAEYIQSAHRPVFIAGRGARGAGKEIRALARQSGALIATSAVAKGLFNGDDFSLGISGGFSSPATADLIRSADLIVSFGCALNMWTMRHGTLISPGTKVIQVDLEDSALGANRAVDLGVLGDSTETAIAVLDILQVLGEPKEKYRSEAVRSRISKESQWRDVPTEDISTPDRIDPRVLTARLDDLLPAERILSVDSGNFMGYPSQYLSVPDEFGFCFTQSFQAIGLGLYTAIGAALAHPERLPVLGTGDGGFLMGISELETAVRLSLPLVCIVYNDAAYGAEVHHFAGSNLDISTVKFPDTDIAAIARGFGAAGVTVRKAEDLEAVSAWLGSSPTGPLVIDAKIASDGGAWWLAEAFKGH